MEHCNKQIDESHDRDHHQYHLYITDKILNGVFDWMVKHKLTVNNKGASWYTRNGKRVIESYGYSGGSSGTIDDKEEMLWKLGHEVFCAAEYLARTVREGKDLARQYFGNDFYNIAAK